MKRQNGTNKKGRITLKKEKKALQNGGYSIILTIVVLAVAIFANKIVEQIPSKYTQFDISTGKLYTIGDDTMEVLKHLDKDITIYYVAQKGSEDHNIEKLLNLYEENSKHIKVEKKDPIVYPNFTKKYTEDEISDNSLIVECGDRSKIISYNNIYEYTMDYNTYQQSLTGFDGEGQVTSALSYVTSGVLQKVYSIEGHNEISVPESIKERIEKANVEVENLSLLTEETVPSDACAIMLNAPEQDYSADEAKKVIDYLEQGGRAIILSDYVGKELPNYESILKQYGIEPAKGLVVETDKKHYVQKPYLLVPSIEYSDITQDMLNGSSYVLLSGCQGFRVKTDEDNSNETANATTTKNFLLTSDGAIVKNNPTEMKSYEKEDGDEEGQYAVGALVTKSIEESVSEKDTDNKDASDENKVTDEKKEMRLVAFASSTILQDSLNNSVADGNYTLYMNAMNWLVDKPDTSITSIPSKSMAMTSLTVTAAKGIVVSLVLCFVLPFLCLVVGAVVCIRRRRL